MTYRTVTSGVKKKSIVLPISSKNHDFYKRAQYFNSLTFNDFEPCGLGVTHVVGLDSLRDSNFREPFKDPLSQ